MIIHAKNKPVQESNTPYQPTLCTMGEPSRLRAIAHLFGMQAPQVESARILQIGRHIGGNVVALAAHYPQAVVIGIDSDIEQIGTTHRMIKKMGLSNLILLHKKLDDIGDSLGCFDYIICHDYYSRLSQADKQIMAHLLGSILSENGLIYLGYNTYPGWKNQETIMELMQYRALSQSDLSDKVAYGRGIVQFMHQHATKSPLQSLPENQINELMTADENLLAHTFFSEKNSGDYFYQVAESLHHAGLQFMGESDYRRHYHTRLPEQGKEDLQKECGTNRIKYEQFIDFIENTHIRQSIFCHQNQVLDAKGHLYHDMLDALHISGSFVYDHERDAWLSIKAGILFDNTAADLFIELNRCTPASISVGEFAQKYLSDRADKEKETLYRLLAALVVHMAVSIRLSALHLPAVVAHKPQALKVLRELAQEPWASSAVLPLFTAEHRPFMYDNITDYFIIAKLDGRKTIYEIQELLFQAALRGQFSFVDEKGNLIQDKKTIRLLSNNTVNSTIRALHQSGMLR